MSGVAALMRFSRDRRGYEHFYLVEPATPRRGRSRSRILYWFRTPPGVRVGRPPFDEEMRRAIEAHNPGVQFDWKRLLATPIPPPAADVERWREKRRLEKAERAERRAAAARPDAELDEPSVAAPTTPDMGDEDIAELADGEPEVAAEADIVDDSAEGRPDFEPAATSPGEAAAPTEASEAVAAPARPRRRRRRRRRGRGPAKPPGTGT